MVSREWKNGSNSGYNCTPFLHSLLTQGKEVVTANHQAANRVFSDSAGLWKKRGQNAGVLPAVAAPNGSPSFGRACSEQTVAALATFLPAGLSEAAAGPNGCNALVNWGHNIFL